MTSATSWVLGRGGLLGSALARTLGNAEFRLSQPIAWGGAEIGAQLGGAAREFSTAVREARARDVAQRWQVCWCAGAGVVGTSPQALASETQTWRLLLLALAQQPDLTQTPGSIVLSSSAGGVHAGNAASRVSERTAPEPISAYGHAKLEQERVLRELLPRFSRLSTLVARFSNLYGPEQRLEKPQGLISHLARSVILGVPVQIYVPLDTMRDYLFADDAARLLAAGLSHLARAEEPVHALKIYASERDTSIARLLDIFRSIAKRRLRVVAGLHATTSQQPRQLCFRSEVWPEDRQLIQTNLIDGIGFVYRRQQQAFQAGRRLTAP
ncbi:MAG TPA: NAD-dependent epimerase/dehydratase family protein [Polyangiaceae bacterium]|nr:NAD-dependent epimerase/dehydratase family protein [Polyangiaceae bacterium]